MGWSDSPTAQPAQASTEDLQRYRWPHVGTPIRHPAQFSTSEVQAILADTHAHYAAQVRPLSGLTKP